MYKKIILFSIILFCSVLPLQAKKSVGTVVSLTGQAWTQNETSKRALSVKADIMEKDTLITDKDGRLLVLFTDDSVLSLGPSTKVAIQSFSFDKTQEPNMAVHIAKGLTRIVSGKIVKQRPQNFKISSPLATMGIRGTITMHDVKPERERHIVESIGKGHDVWIKGLDGKTVNLTSSLTKVDLFPSEPTPTAGQNFEVEEQKTMQQFFIPVPANLNSSKSPIKENMQRQSSIQGQSSIQNQNESTSQENSQVTLPRPHKE